MVNGKTVYKYHGEGLGRPDVKWRKEAVDALRTGVEGMMTDWFALANDMACVNGKTIQPEHAEMAYKMMRPGYVSGRGKGASLESVILGSGFDSRMGLQERIVEQLEKTPADVVAWVWWKMTAKSKTSERSPPKRPTAEQKAKMIKKISKISSARPVEVAVKDTLGTDPRWYRAEEVKKGPKRGSVEYVLKQKTKETKSGKKVKVDLDPPPQLTDPGREDLVEGVSDLIVRLRAACAVREQPRLFTEAKILQALEWHNVDSKATRKKRTREGMEENLVEYQKRAAKRKEVKQQRAAVATVGDSGAEQGTKDGAEAKAGTEAKVDHEAKGKASQESEASGSDSDSENEDK